MSSVAYRVLALESDPACAVRLRTLIRERVDADVTIAGSADEAIAVLTAARPDAILISLLVTPGDEARLLASLRDLPDGSDVPVLMVPPLVAQDPAPPSRRGPFGLFGRRPAAVQPAYDRAALGARIEEALEQSRTRRSSRLHVLPAGGPAADPRAASIRSFPRPGSGIIRPARPARPRPHRWSPDDLPWPSQLRLSWGADVRVLNISQSGLLVESPRKLVPQTIGELHLWTPRGARTLTACIVRSEVAAASASRVLYRMAVAFDRRFDLVPERPALAGTPPSAASLATLVSRVTAEIENRQTQSSARAAFERGVNELLPACSVTIRSAPATPADDRESIYFTIPDGSRQPSILQVTFEPRYQPDADDLRLLRSAAAAAAIILLATDEPAGAAAQIA